MVTTRASTRQTRATAKKPNYTGNPAPKPSTSSSSARVPKKATGARKPRSRGATSSISPPAAMNSRKRKGFEEKKKEVQEPKKTKRARTKKEAKVNGHGEVEVKEEAQLGETQKEEQKGKRGSLDGDVDMEDVREPKREAMNDKAENDAEEEREKKEEVKEKKNSEEKPEDKLEDKAAEKTEEEKEGKVKEEERVAGKAEESKEGKVKEKKRAVEKVEEKKEGKLEEEMRAEEEPKEKPEEKLNNFKTEDTSSFSAAGQSKSPNPAESKAAITAANNSFNLPQEESKASEPSSDPKDLATPSSSSYKPSVTPSAILEKGIIYFFFRPRVSVEHPGSLEDIQRSYIVLRPLLPDAKLEESAKLQDDGRVRLIALPKKRLPTGGYERFLAFVEEPSISIKDLKEKFLKESHYMTKTIGERVNPAAEPIGEGVYAITKSKNERKSHLAYILTTPATPNELQGEFGLKGRGSFILSVRNPMIPAPPGVGIQNSAEFSEEIVDEFSGLRWGAPQPKHLDYKNAEILFIGEKHFSSSKDTEGSKEVLEELEEEDEKRVEHLDGTELVFEDLELDGKEFSAIKGTW